jgi:hypothetical protein
MRKYIALITLALFTVEFTGCAGDSPPASTRPAIDLVQAGKDIEFPGGYIVHVTKRDGSSLEGIHIHFPHPDGPASEITADTGTIKSGIPDHSDYENELIYKNQITIRLKNARTVTGTTNSTSAFMVIVLHS